MSLFKNYKQYKETLEEYKLTNDINIKKLLKKLKRAEIGVKVFGLLIFLIISLLVYGMLSSRGGSGDGVAGLIIVTLVVIFILYLLFLLPFMYAKIRHSINLDNEFFNTFLIKKLQIFYSVDEANKFNYEKIEHVTSSDNSGKSNQAIIEICYIAILKNAEGVIITNQNTASVTSGSVSKKGGGNISTEVIHSAEGILIKNIQKEDLHNNDLSYWFDLKEKGAITEDEYLSKKNDILNS